MTIIPYKRLLLLVLLLLCKAGMGQAPAFYNLSIDNGLYDNHVRSLALNRQGFLWIGTEEGLNLYDGHSFRLYLKAKHPELPSNAITFLYCDSSNRLWIGSGEGAAFMNERQQLTRIILNDSIAQFNTRAIVETTTKGIVLISSAGQFVFNEKQNKWDPVPAIPALLDQARIRAVQSCGADRVLFATDSSIFLYDYGKRSIVNQYSLPGVTALCKIKGEAFAAVTANGEVMQVNIAGGNIRARHQLTAMDPVDIKQAANGDLVIATGFSGLASINASGVVSYFIHDPVVPTSLISNSVYRIVTGASGEVVIGTSTSGVSIYNTNLSQAGFTGFFKDAAGQYYDNYTGRMLEAGNKVWIAAYDRLIQWDRKKNTAVFYYHENNSRGKAGEIIPFFADRAGIIWTARERKGIAWLDERTGKFTDLVLDTSLSPVFKSKYILDMMPDDNGLVWVCSSRGVFTINASNKKADPAMNTPLLKELSGKIVHNIFKDRRQRLWFATINNGVYCFDKNGEQLFHYTAAGGLPSDICYMVRADQQGRYFVSTSKGMAIISEAGQVSALTMKNGLRYERCESVIIDKDGIAWFSNRKCLVRYDAANHSMEFFDEKAGLLNNGFRVGSCLQTSTGELLWGGYRGISYFDPGKIKNVLHPLKVSVYSLALKDSVISITGVHRFSTSYANNSVSFSFAGTHLGIPGITFYRYRLKGFDKDWVKGEDIGQARYSALPPGTYQFELEASMDGVKWVAAPRQISVTIVPPLWMRWWFITLAVAVLSGTAWWFVQNRNKKIKQQQEDLETEKAVNHFANSLHEQQTVETILWDVARNCIGRLQFEDCVVYLVDEEKNVLVQKAAYGPKSPENFRIIQPLEIPLGKGITGTVALSGKGEIVADTSKDSRYIMDESRRLSEIAVPITWGNKVIGVIDCEHHKKNYFTQKHLSILTTIASLCANKIVRARAEEEKQRAQSVLMDTQQKMAEVEMQALRAQMNPHFIFNCLNSINRYIVKSDQATASLYLTRFAKLIRLILDNSGSKNVSLSNELEALKLYIDMEALRFDKKFTYRIDIDRNVNADSIELPPLIIQPYVENAIWHGLLHKDGGGQLTISIRQPDETMLECMIEDNGVGRHKAGVLKSKSATSRKSLGMQLTQNRLALLNRHAALNASITIIDLTDEKNEAAGTRVILLIPV